MELVFQSLFLERPYYKLRLLELMDCLIEPLSISRFSRFVWGFFSSFSSSCSLSFQENELEVSNLGTVEEALISRHSIGKEQEDMKMTLEPRALLPQKLSGVLGYLLQSLLPSRPVDHSQLGLQ